MPQNDFWERLKKQLIEVSTTVADFTEEQALIGKLKFEILSLKRQIDQTYRELGIRVHHLARTSALSATHDDREVKRFINLIEHLETQVEQKKLDIVKVSETIRNRRAPAKTAGAARPAKPTAPPVASAPKRRGPKPKATAANAVVEPSLSSEPKKRGRKPKPRDLNLSMDPLPKQKPGRKKTKSS